METKIKKNRESEDKSGGERYILERSGESEEDDKGKNKIDRLSKLLDQREVERETMYSYVSLYRTLQFYF